MVTVNVETDLDIANGARGEIVGIKLHPEEPPLSLNPIVQLTYPLIYILVKLDRTRMQCLPSLSPVELYRF